MSGSADRPTFSPCSSSSQVSRRDADSSVPIESPTAKMRLRSRVPWAAA